ncbi:hypothetical protein ACFV0D_20015, partial [Streptomyces sp. NPDC059556]
LILTRSPPQYTPPAPSRAAPPGRAAPRAHPPAPAALEKAGQNVVNPRLQDWYVALQKEKIGVAGIGEMMAGRATPAETIKKIQKFADEAAKDSSIKHYKHQ